MIDLVVNMIGLGLAGFVVWWFWLSGSKGARAVPAASGIQEVRVLVKDGYTPDTMLVEPGRPVRLIFTRKESAVCSERVVFPSLGIHRELPENQDVIVEFVADKPGVYPFSCQMNLYRGKVVAEATVATAKATKKATVPLN